MKKTKLILVAFLVVAMVLSLGLAACEKECQHVDANHDGKCDNCGADVEVVHTWDAATGKCSECGAVCAHTWDVATGKCTTCGFVCAHDFSNGSECSICGFFCEHDWDAATGICKKCNYACTHDFGDDSVCDTCGWTCVNHEWDAKDGKCDICGIEHDHQFDVTTAICGGCGYMCPHTFNDDNVCTICGHSHAWNATTGVCTKCNIGCEHNYQVEGDFYVCQICGHQIDVSVVNGADYIDLSVYKSMLIADLDEVRGALGVISAEIEAAVLEQYNAGVAAIDAAIDIKTAKDAYVAAEKAVVECVPLADGLQNFSGLTAEEKTEILGILEAFAIRNGMLGVTLYENGSYVMYNERITLGTENYISGYGFGTLAEGSINADLASENNPAWKRYYHTIEASDPGTVNYLNDQGSQVGDIYTYMGASYYTNFMNSTKDGYDWVPELAVSDPEVVGELDKNGQSAKWRFEIRTGLKYSTNSTNASRKAFDGRAVVAEDFITPFKLLLNQANGLYRGGELANQTGAAAIKGAKAYYEATKNSKKGILSDAEADFSGVGIKVYEENGKTYFEFELGAPVTMFYARYYISSSMYMPVPADFIKLVTPDYYLGFNANKTETPVDNSLSLGAYTLERWDSDAQIVFKKNPNYVYADTKYAIAGIHINILTAAQEDKEASIKEFLAGKTDSTSIPDTYLSEYASDPRTRTTTGDSCLKLNINALNQEDWIKLFGKDGTYSQTSEENYWEVEPALSNAHFRNGLSYALNRKEFATLKGSVASVNYFSSNYMSDPENGISYNATEAHQNAIARLLEDTDGFGYSVELARINFRIALDELEAAGLIMPGTKENPTVIELQVAWMYASNEEGYHKYVKQYWETAFNDESVSGGKYKLVCTFWVGNSWSDVYYEKMLKGQYDIGFGSITGNPLDPLSFFNVNSTDPVIANEFTLNWAIDTNTVTEALVYNGQRWSYDGLYTATQETAIINDGVNKKSSEITGVKSNKNGDGSFDIEIKLANNALASVEMKDLVIFGGDDDTVPYVEFSLYNDDGKPIDGVTIDIVFDAEANVTTITLKIAASVIAKVPVSDNQGIDLYYKVTVGGNTSVAIKTAGISFE